MNIVGYHGTCTVHRNSIDENGLDPKLVKQRNDHWLGQGVYFFDDRKKAIWWAQDIAGKPWNKGSFAIVYKCDIVASDEEILNLDDEKQLDDFYDEIIEYCCLIKPKDGKVPVFNYDQMRAVFFDYYKIKKEKSVIIKTFPKDAVKYGKIRGKEHLGIQKKLAKSLQIYYFETQICVSKKECIKCPVLDYNEEDEVI